MSLHANDFDPDMAKEVVRRFFERGREPQQDLVQKKLVQLIRPTGQFLEGKLTQHDEGEFAFAVLIKNGKIIIEFNSSINWLGMNPDQAIKLGRTLIKTAREARAKGESK